MVNKSKSFFYITVLSLSAIVIALLGKGAYVYATGLDGKKFDNWVVHCAKHPETKKQHCELVQSLVDKDNNKVLEIHISKVTDGKTNKIQMFEVLPLGVKLVPGTSLIADKKDLLLPAKFVSCYNEGCVAAAEVSEENVNQLMKADHLAVAAVFNEQKNIEIPHKGLDRGLKALGIAKAK